MAKINVASVLSLLAGVLFLFAALGPTLFGDRPLNATYLTLGAFFVVLGLALRRKTGAPPGSAGA